MGGEYQYKKGDVQVILALAQGKTQREAAALGGIIENTVSKRMRDPEFRAEVSRLRTMFLHEAAGRLAKSSSEAADILLDLAKGKGSPDHVKRSAAADILNYSMRLLELSELDERIRQLEEMALVMENREEH